MATFTRKTDELGRITLGVRLCRQMGWEFQDRIGFQPSGNTLILFGEESERLATTWSHLEAMHRVVVPVEYRRGWGFQSSDRIDLEIAMEEGEVVLRPIALRCSGCGRTGDLVRFGQNQCAICPDCLAELLYQCKSSASAFFHTMP